MPENYVMATDADFIESYGSIKYVGAGEYVIIPENYNGNPIMFYSGLFGNYSGSQLKGVASSKTDILSIYNMFGYSKNITTLELILSNIPTSLSGMFTGCTSLTTLDLSRVTTKAGDIYLDNLCTNCSSLESIVFNPNTTMTVKSMMGMFQNCTSLITLDLSMFDVSNTISSDTEFMFTGCTSLTTCYARTQADADKFNASYGKPGNVCFVVKNEPSKMFSFSNGLYWSHFPVAKVFENGTYSLKAKRENGQEGTYQINITNINKTLPPAPQLNLTSGGSSYTPGNYAWGDIAVAYANKPANCTAYSKKPGGAWQAASSFSFSAIDGETQSCSFRYIDSLGNIGPTIVVSVLINSVAPMISNTLVNLRLDNSLITEVVLGVTPPSPKFSISYNNGATWSDLQIGRFFRLEEPAPGTYNIKVKVVGANGKEVVGNAITFVVPAY